MALFPAHLLQHLEPQVLVSQLLLGEVGGLGFLRKEQSAACGLQPSAPREGLQPGPALMPPQASLSPQVLTIKPWSPTPFSP